MKKINKKIIFLDHNKTMISMINYNPEYNSINKKINKRVECMKLTLKPKKKR